jgi:hypothetical protein
MSLIVKMGADMKEGSFSWLEITQEALFHHEDHDHTLIDAVLLCVLCGVRNEKVFMNEFVKPRTCLYTN